METITVLNNFWWYLLYVKSNTEIRVINEMTKYIETLSLSYKVEPFILESEQYYRNKKIPNNWKDISKATTFPRICIYRNQYARCGIYSSFL